MAQNRIVLDAATRFLRTNPELLAVARRGAAEHGVALEVLLADTVRRVRRSGFETVAKEEMVFRAPDRGEGGATKVIRVGGPGIDDARPRLAVVASGDPR
jgi:hypothetical protein